MPDIQNFAKATDISAAWQDTAFQLNTTGTHTASSACKNFNWVCNGLGTLSSTDQGKIESASMNTGLLLTSWGNRLSSRSLSLVLGIMWRYICCASSSNRTHSGAIQGSTTEHKAEHLNKLKSLVDMEWQKRCWCVPVGTQNSRFPLIWVGEHSLI